MPKVSILTPAYCDISAKVDWLDEMLQSVVGQSLVDWEIILIDDKSPLPLDAVKVKYANDERIRWLENAQNSGPALTRNTAAALARSDCFLALDSDDVLASPEVLEYMYDAWLVDKTKIIYGNLQMYAPAGGGRFTKGRVIQLSDYTFELAMNLNGIMPVTAMHSRACHEAAGGWKDELREGLEDLEYWIAAGEHGFCGHRINETIFLYRRQENSRAYKMKHVDLTYTKQQEKIKAMHVDTYAGRFTVACCGKGNSGGAGSAADPVVISRQNQQNATRITTLDGYEEKDLVWVAYNGPKRARFDIAVRGPAGLPASYTILGTGHFFQVHKSHFSLFSDRQRLGFQMNVGDPRKQPEPEPVTAPPVAPPARELPPAKPQLSTIVRPDRAAMQSDHISIQPVPAPRPAPPEVIIEPNPPEAISQTMTVGPAYLTLADLALGPKLTETLAEEGWSVGEIAKMTPQKLSSLPGIGIRRANTIIERAQGLINA